MNFTKLFEDRDYHIPDTSQFSDSVTEFELKEKIIKAIGKLYLEANMTVKDICHCFDFPYKPEYQKLFYQLYGSKGLNHGGARHNLSKIKVA